MSRQLADSSSLEFGRYLRILRRRWLVVVAGGLIGGLLAVAYLAVKPTQATATTLVDLNVISLEPFNFTREPSGLIDTQTEVQTARSSAVVGQAAEQLGGDVTPSEVRAALQVELYADATVLRITYTAGTVDQAVAGADEVAQQFLSYRGELASAKLTRISNQLSKRRDLLRSDLVEVNQRLAKANPGSPAAIQAESDRQLLNIELNSLLGQVAAINGIDTTGGTVLTAAGDVEAVVSPRRGLVLATGLVAGLLLGLVGAFVRHALDRRILDDFQIHDAGGGDVLAELHSLEATVPTALGDLDAVRSVWERLFTSLPDNHPVVAVADISSPQVPSEVSVNMALAVCEMGRSVELVLLEFEPELVGILVQDLALEEIGNPRRITRYRSSAYPGLLLSVIGLHGSEVDPAGGMLKELLRAEDRPGDMTVLALPPAASRSARLAAGRLANLAVVVVAKRDSRSDVLRALVAELGSVRAAVAGSVVVPRGRRVRDFSRGAPVPALAHSAPVASGFPSARPPHDGAHLAGGTRAQAHELQRAEVEAPEFQRAEVEAPELQRAEVEAPEVQAAVAEVPEVAATRGVSPAPNTSVPIKAKPKARGPVTGR